MCTFFTIILVILIFLPFGTIDLFLFFYFADLQMVNISLRVLSRPIAAQLPTMYRTLGTDYDERVLPSIVNEVCCPLFLFVGFGMLNPLSHWYRQLHTLC